MPTASSRIFLSYARADLDFARQLRERLIAEGLDPPWHDQTHMSAGQWWSQIENALTSSACEHVLLVLSGAALAEDRHHIVKREWRLARREGKNVIPVETPGGLTSDDRRLMSKWMQAIHGFNFEGTDSDRQWANLVDALRKPGQQPRRPDPLRKLPEAEGYVRRTTKVAEIKAALLDERREAKATTVVLSGAGGFGKSTLAIDIMNDREIQDACYDGILWVELHEELVRIAKGPRGAEALRDAIKARIESLIRDLTGAGEVLDDFDRAKERLGQLLAHKRVLLVIDDAWDKNHAKHFIEAAPEAAKLVTSRRTDIIGDAIIGVDHLSEDEALDLISLRLTPEPLAAEKALLHALALGRAGGWPLLLRLINGQLRLATTARPGWTAKPLSKAVADLTATFDREGLKALDEATRDRAVRLSVGISFEMLRDEDQHRAYPPGFHEARYLDLAGFQEAKVPIATIARLWAHLGVLKFKAVVLDAKDGAKRDAQEAAYRDAAVAESVAVLERLYALALLQALDAVDDNGVVQLHDVMWRYLSEVQGDDARSKFHRQFVLAYDVDSGERVSDMGERERRYFYTWYPMHLAAADKIDRESADQQRPFRAALDDLLMDPNWMQRKLNALGNPQALIADYDAHATGQMQTFIGRTLRLTTGICARDKRQLLPQLLGRLMACADPAAPAFLTTARRLIRPPALLEQRFSLTPPGAETTRFEGHTGAVTALAVLPDGRLASASVDETIRLWDLQSCTETTRLEGHTGAVNALTLLPDGRLASASDDHTISLWDLQSGTETDMLEGHAHSVMALAMLPDGRLASASQDKTIRLWDLPSGTETARFEGHRDRITALAVLPDGRLASASADETIRLWDLQSGAETARLDGRASILSFFTALAVLPDGRLASATEHETIWLWDLRAGAKTARLDGHTANVKALAVLSDGRLASASQDQTIRLWDLQSGAETARLDGHTDQVKALAVLPDGRLASSGEDNTIRLWDLQLGAEITPLDGHASAVTALAVLPDGRLASASYAETIRLWDLQSGAQTARLEGNTGAVNALSLLPDGRLASGADVYFPKTTNIRLWDLQSGAEIARLDGHTDRVKALAVLPDGRLAASGGEDNTIRLWDLQSGAETARLVGHTGLVEALVVLPDGRLASGGEDNTIRLWDFQAGTEPTLFDGYWSVVRAHAVFDGHKSVVRALAVVADGRLASAGDDNAIRLWDLQSGTETARLEGHMGAVNELALLPDGRLASASEDKTIRLWDLQSRKEVSRMEVDAPVWRLCALQTIDGKGCRLVAGDSLGRLHWLEIVE